MVSEVEVTPVKPVGGLVAFASVVVDGKLYLGSIAVYKSLRGPYRIVYPAKRLGDRQLQIYHPIDKVLGLEVKLAVTAKCEELFEKSDDRYSQAPTPRGRVQADEA